ncbi:type 1 fimbrial protein [Pseudomonas hygromyciniae]|uniref:Type 1 fimbrial protein n=1 Tax=Pseudomonas hygromyciniae TaxID=2812000 RepID=A0ABX7K4V3_9PSED|nr:type 1 fimbrial protein [Pseudomonas hygromyciniae]MBN0980212.1 type 1 fimbrial protein [Pseudomonas hygromyciniae]QSB41740.1 type 1 fimbrial protein [Pseudomonas hygromyciniae]
MSSQGLAVGISLFFVLVSGSGQAATTVGHGVIQFHGSIVEATCTAGGGSGATLALSGCPTFASASSISARGVEPVPTVRALDHTAVKVKLVTETTGDGRYFDRRYSLNDGAGKPLRSGAYLVTLSYP